MFAELRWNQGQLVYASVSTLVTQATLDEFYRTGQPKATYLRLDLNYETLGLAFAHCLPHIHVGDDDAPRVALGGGPDGNVIVDYLEFLYLNYAHQKWAAWARRIWMKANASDAAGAGKTFDSLQAAFNENQIGLLRDQRDQIVRLKKALRSEKNRIFPCRVHWADRELLEYP